MQKTNASREETIAKMLAGYGINRFGRPDEIGRLVAYLCSPKAEFIQGTVIDMDGGETRAL
jgi:3-oxoacyl-[acyl-carrier protein] reductase